MTKQLEALIAEMKDNSMVTAEDFNTLIAVLERAQQHNKELQTKLDATEAVALALRDDTRGAEKRIAELDASPLAVKLHKRSVGEVMHISGFSRDYAEGWCAGNDNAIHEIRAAGGTVSEGE